MNMNNGNFWKFSDRENLLTGGNRDNVQENVNDVRNITALSQQEHIKLYQMITSTLYSKFHKKLGLMVVNKFEEKSNYYEMI